MAAHTAGLRIQRRRVEHIQQLMAEIADRQRIVAHLMTITFRAGYYFLTAACLTAGLIGLVSGRHYLATTWGAAGIILVLLWAGLKVAEWAGNRVVAELRKELAKGRSRRSAGAGSGAQPAAGDIAGSATAPLSPDDERRRTAA
jgi:hypothetical protein